MLCENCSLAIGRLIWEKDQSRLEAQVLPETIEECPSRKDILDVAEKGKEAIHKALKERASGGFVQGRLPL